jgi:hypothetical protein
MVQVKLLEQLLSEIFGPVPLQIVAGIAALVTDGFGLTVTVIVKQLRYMFQL